jgi:hypothetical protein
MPLVPKLHWNTYVGADIGTSAVIRETDVNLDITCLGDLAFEDE